MKFIIRSEISEKLLIINDNLMIDINNKLNNTKSLIDNYPKEWEIVKKQVNDYEYIYTSSFKKKNISNIVPISRSYYKFTEIYNNYNFKKINDKYKILCLAEAPGGFIQSIFDIINNEDIDVLNAITLLSNDRKIPSWHNIIKRNNKIKFHNGVKGNGDLYDLENILSFFNDIKRSSLDLITGDGGFDNSLDYSKQEEHSLKLIYSEIFVALNLQTKGGSFICKIFDIFKSETITLINILKLSYNEVYIHKPYISRMSNSEKYIVCLDYKGYNKEIINLMCHHFNDNKINIPIDQYFINDILNINKKYVENQIKYIEKGIYNIENNNIIKYPTKKQLELAIDWCNENNISINKDCIFIRNHNNLIQV